MQKIRKVREKAKESLVKYFKYVLFVFGLLLVVLWVA